MGDKIADCSSLGAWDIKAGVQLPRCWSAALWGHTENLKATGLEIRVDQDSRLSSRLLALPFAHDELDEELSEIVVISDTLYSHAS